MQCAYFDAGRCRSCTLLDRSYADQLAGKEQHCRDLLPDGVTWLPAVASRAAGFRNKAKMVVAGTVERPTLGILDPGGHGVDLSQCPLYPAELQAAFPVLTDFVTQAQLTPYDVPNRRGELKYLIVTVSPDGEFMLRFVLRSEELLGRIRTHLPALLAQLPALAVVSANIHAEHKAVLEGETEIHLAGAAAMRMRVNELDLYLRPRSFFQTNTDVAAALYRQATGWIEAAGPSSVWDLYCGVGGFALHAAAPGREVTGIEISAEAIASARRSAREAGLVGVDLRAGDATEFALSAGRAPDLVLVNPPRRGIGAELAGWLETSGVRDVVYSSCNAASLARDLAAMPSLRPREARLLDMFPQTNHYEVVTRLERV